MYPDGLMRKQGVSSALRAMGRREAAIGRPLGYGTPRSGYWLWARGERLKAGKPIPHIHYPLPKERGEDF